MIFSTFNDLYYLIDLDYLDDLHYINWCTTYTCYTTDVLSYYYMLKCLHWMIRSTFHKYLHYLKRSTKLSDATDFVPSLLLKRK